MRPFDWLATCRFPVGFTHVPPRIGSFSRLQARYAPMFEDFNQILSLAQLTNNLGHLSDRASDNFATLQACQHEEPTIRSQAEFKQY